MPTIRDPVPTDEAAWRRLWSDYCAFYESTVAETATVRTWQRMLDPASPVFGRLAIINGGVVGFSVNVLHDGTWTTAPVCYLEDLFVNPQYRGRGCGRLLIGDLVDQARRKGWSRLYWHTRANNSARQLYDEFVSADDFVRYRLVFN